MERENESKKGRVKEMGVRRKREIKRDMEKGREKRRDIQTK